MCSHCNFRFWKSLPTHAEPLASSHKCWNKHTGFMKVPQEPGNRTMSQSKSIKPFFNWSLNLRFIEPISTSLKVTHLVRKGIPEGHANCKQYSCPSLESLDVTSHQTICGWVHTHVHGCMCTRRSTVHGCICTVMSEENLWCYSSGTICFLVCSETGSLTGQVGQPGWPGSPRDPHVPSFPMLGLQMHTHHAKHLLKIVSSRDQPQAFIFVLQALY